MHPITSLLLVQGIERERYGAARHSRPAPRPTKRSAPSRPSHWMEMMRVYRLGFAAKP